MADKSISQATPNRIFMAEKVARFFYWEANINAYIPVDSFEFLSDLDAIKNGDEAIFTFKRVDMTDMEFATVMKNAGIKGVNHPRKTLIDTYQIVPAPQTGIGWVAVQEWDNTAGQYVHYSSHRYQADAEDFISKMDSQKKQR